MIFTGFNDIKYPEYEVITPQTHLSFTVRSLNVQEEENMKGSLMTPVKVTEHLNKCIYDVLVKKPDNIADFKDFLKQITLKDRDALLYGLYHITYEDIRNYDVRCGTCKKEYPITVKASDMFSFDSYPGDDVLSKRVKVDLQISKGITAYIKQPSLQDELDALKSLVTLRGTNLDSVTQTLIVDRFEQDIEAQAKANVFSDRYDILEAFKSLPARDRRLINRSYVDHFGKYGVELKMKSFCSSCGAEEVITVDLVENFFRMVYTV